MERSKRDLIFFRTGRLLPLPAIEFVFRCLLKYIPLYGINLTLPFNSHKSPIQLSWKNVVEDGMGNIYSSTFLRNAMQHPVNLFLIRFGINPSLIFNSEKRVLF